MVWQELRARGYEGDVAFSAQLDRCQAVPTMDQSGWLKTYTD